MPDPSTRRNTPACDFLVIGGGVMGLASAVALATDGLSVTLVDRAPGPAAESSGAAAGIVSLLYPWEYPEALQRLAVYSRGLYPGWFDADDIGWSEAGLVSFDTDGAPDTVRRLDAAGVHIHAPVARAPDGSALWLPEVATVEPRLLATALAARAEALGVRLEWGRQVDALAGDRERVTGVILADGTTVAAGAVLMSAGAWSRALLHEIGISVAVRPVRGQVIEMLGPPGLVGPVLVYGHRYLLSRRDGRIVVGSTSEEAGFDASTTTEAADALKAVAAQLVPATADFPVRAHWAGLRPGSPDGMPLIGPVPHTSGLWLNLGHFRNGITLAPGSAALLAALVAGREPPVPAAAFMPKP